MSSLAERRHIAQTAPTMPKDTQPPCAVPKESKRDLRPDNAREVGKLGGIAKGTELPIRGFSDRTDEVVEAAANRILETGSVSLRVDPKLGPLTDADKLRLTRASGIPAEEFVARMSAKLESLSDLIAARMKEKLEADLYKPAELTFALAVAIDKHSRLTGRTSLANASVNIQVNNYGETTNKDDLIRSILGQTKGEAVIGETVEVV